MIQQPAFQGVQLLQPQKYSNISPIDKAVNSLQKFTEISNFRDFININKIERLTVNDNIHQSPDIDSPQFLKIEKSTSQYRDKLDKFTFAQIKRDIPISSQSAFVPSPALEKEYIKKRSQKQFENFERNYSQRQTKSNICDFIEIVQNTKEEIKQLYQNLDNIKNQKQQMNQKFSLVQVQADKILNPSRSNEGGSLHTEKSEQIPQRYDILQQVSDSNKNININDDSKQEIQKLQQKVKEYEKIFEQLKTESLSILTENQQIKQLQILIQYLNTQLSSEREEKNNLIKINENLTQQIKQLQNQVFSKPMEKFNLTGSFFKAINQSKSSQASIRTKQASPVNQDSHNLKISKNSGKQIMWTQNQQMRYNLEKMKLLVKKRSACTQPDDELLNAILPSLPRENLNEAHEINDEKNKIIEKLQISIQELNEMIEDKNNEVNDQAKQYQQNILQLQQTIQSQDGKYLDKMKNMEYVIGEQKCKILDLQKFVTTLNNLSSSYQDQLQEYRYQIQQLIQQNQTDSDMICEIKIKEKDQQKLIDSLMTRNIGLNKEAQTDIELQDVQILFDVKDQFQGQKQKINQVLQQLKDFANENNKLVDYSKNLEGQKINLEQTLIQFKSECYELQKQAEVFRFELNSTKLELQKVKEVNKQLSSELEQNYKDKDIQMEKEKEEITRLNNQILNLNECIEKNQEKTAYIQLNFENQIQLKEIQIQNLIEEIQAKDFQIYSQSTQIKDCITQKKQIELEMIKIQQEKQLQQNCNDQRIENLENLLVEKNKHNQDLQCQFHQLKSLLNSAQLDNQSLVQSNDLLKIYIIEKDQSINKLMQELKENQNQLNALILDNENLVVNHSKLQTQLIQLEEFYNNSEQLLKNEIQKQIIIQQEKEGIYQQGQILQKDLMQIQQLQDLQKQSVQLQLVEDKEIQTDEEANDNNQLIAVNQQLSQSRIDQIDVEELNVKNVQNQTCQYQQAALNQQSIQEIKEISNKETCLLNKKQSYRTQLLNQKIKEINMKVKGLKKQKKLQYKQLQKMIQTKNETILNLQNQLRALSDYLENSQKNDTNQNIKQIQSISYDNLIDNNQNYINENQIADEDKHFTQNQEFQRSHNFQNHQSRLNDHFTSESVQNIYNRKNIQSTQLIQKLIEQRSLLDKQMNEKFTQKEFNYNQQMNILNEKIKSFLKVIESQTQENQEITEKMENLLYQIDQQNRENQNLQEINVKQGKIIENNQNLQKEFNDFFKKMKDEKLQQTEDFNRQNKIIELLKMNENTLIQELYNKQETIEGLQNANQQLLNQVDFLKEFLQSNEQNNQSKQDLLIQEKDDLRQQLLNVQQTLELTDLINSQYELQITDMKTDHKKMQGQLNEKQAQIEQLQSLPQKLENLVDKSLQVIYEMEDKLCQTEEEIVSKQLYLELQKIQKQSEEHIQITSHDIIKQYEIVQDLTIQLEKQQLHTSQMQIQNSELTQEKKKLDLQNIQLQEQIQQQSDMNVQIQEKLIDKEKVISDLDIKEKLCNDLQQKIIMLEAFQNDQNDSHDQIIKSLEQEILELNKRNNNQQNEIKQLSNLSDNGIQKNQKLQQDTEVQKDQNQTQLNQINDLKIANSYLQTNLNNLNIQNSEQQKEILKLEQEIVIINGQNLEIEKISNEFQNQKNKLQQNMVRQKEIKNKIKKENQNLQNQILELQEEIHQKISIQDQLNEEISILKNQFEYEQQQTQKLQDEISTLHQLLTESEQENIKQIENTEVIQEQLNDTLLEIQKCQWQYDKLNIEIKDLTLKLRNSENELNEKNLEVCKLNDDIAKKMNKIDVYAQTDEQEQIDNNGVKNKDLIFQDFSQQYVQNEENSILQIIQQQKQQLEQSFEEIQKQLIEVASQNQQLLKNLDAKIEENDHSKSQIAQLRNQIQFHIEEKQQLLNTVYVQKEKFQDCSLELKNQSDLNIQLEKELKQKQQDCLDQIMQYKNLENDLLSLEKEFAKHQNDDKLLIEGLQVENTQLQVNLCEYASINQKLQDNMLQQNKLNLSYKEVIAKQQVQIDEQNEIFGQLQINIEIKEKEIENLKNSLKLQQSQLIQTIKKYQENQLSIDDQQKLIQEQKIQLEENEQNAQIQQQSLNQMSLKHKELQINILTLSNKIHELQNQLEKIQIEFNEKNEICNNYQKQITNLNMQIRIKEEQNLGHLNEQIGLIEKLNVNKKDLEDKLNEYMSMNDKIKGENQDQYIQLQNQIQKIQKQQDQIDDLQNLTKQIQERNEDLENTRQLSYQQLIRIQREYELLMTNDENKQEVIDRLQKMVEDMRKDNEEMQRKNDKLNRENQQLKIDIIQLQDELKHNMGQISQRKQQNNLFERESQTDNALVKSHNLMVDRDTVMEPLESLQYSSDQSKSKIIRTDQSVQVFFESPVGFKDSLFGNKTQNFGKKNDYQIMNIGQLPIFETDSFDQSENLIEDQENDLNKHKIQIDQNLLQCEKDNKVSFNEFNQNLPVNPNNILVVQELDIELENDSEEYEQLNALNKIRKIENKPNYIEYQKYDELLNQFFELHKNYKKQEKIKDLFLNQISNLEKELEIQYQQFIEREKKLKRHIKSIQGNNIDNDSDRSFSKSDSDINAQLYLQSNDQIRQKHTLIQELFDQIEDQKQQIQTLQQELEEKQQQNSGDVPILQHTAFFENEFGFKDQQLKDLQTQIKNLCQIQDQMTKQIVDQSKTEQELQDALDNQKEKYKQYQNQSIESQDAMMLQIDSLRESLNQVITEKEKEKDILAETFADRIKKLEIMIEFLQEQKDIKFNEQISQAQNEAQLQKQQYLKSHSEVNSNNSNISSRSKEETRQQYKAFNRLTTMTAGMMSSKMDYISLGVLGQSFKGPNVKQQQNQADQ